MFLIATPFTIFGRPWPVSGWFSTLLVEWPGDDAPAPGDLDVGGQAADRHAAHERVRVAGDVDHGDRVPERVGDVERGAVGADREVARIGAIEVGRAGRDLGDLREAGPGSIRNART